MSADEVPQAADDDEEAVEPWEPCPCDCGTYRAPALNRIGLSRIGPPRRQGH